jgi:hypothetical protein
MPDLGKAVYTLALQTTSFEGGMDRMEARAAEATGAIAASMGEADAAIASLGGTAQGAAAEVVAAQEEMAAAAEAAAMKEVAAANMGKAAFAAAGTKMTAMSAAATKHLKLIGAGAAFFIAKGGIEELKAQNEQMALAATHIKTTGGVAGVTAKHVKELSERYLKLAGTESSVTQKAEALLLTFPNIRNMMGKNNDIFDQASLATQNLARTFHRDLGQSAILVGKALNDPERGMLALRRIGVSLSSSQQALVKRLIATGHGLQAQKVILAELTRETGKSAEAYGKTFAGQLDRAKGQLKDNSAVLIQALIPAFKTFIQVLGFIAKFMAHHTKLVRALIFAYIAWKVALIAWAIAAKIVWFWEKALAITELILIRRQMALRGASVLATAAMMKQAGAEKGMSIAQIRLSRAISGTIIKIKAMRFALGRAGLYGAAIAAGFAIGTLAIKILHLDGPLKKMGAKLYDFAAKLHLVKGEISKASKDAGSKMSDPAIQKKLAGAYGHASKLPKWARDKYIEATVGPGFTFHDASVTAHARARRNGPKALTEEGGAQPTAAQLNKDFMEGAKKTVSPEALAKKRAAAAKKAAAEARRKASAAARLAVKAQQDHMTQLAINETKAERGKSGTAVLEMRKKYIQGLLKTEKLSLQQKLTFERQLNSIDEQIARASKTAAKKRADLKKLGPDLMPAKTRIRLAQAERTKRLTDDMKVLHQEEMYLRGLLKNKKLSLKKKAEIEEALTRVSKAEADLRKKEKERIKKENAAKLNSLKEIQAGMDLRGSFFSQFAPNIFGQSSAGLTLGPQGKQMTYNQNNTFHELPNDRHKLARQMRLSASAAMD